MSESGLSRTGAELAQFDDQRDGCDRTDAGNGHQHRMAALEHWIAVEKPSNFGVETGNMGLDAFDEPFEFGLEEGCFGGAKTVCSATPSALAAWRARAVPARLPSFAKSVAWPVA